MGDVCIDHLFLSNDQSVEANGLMDLDEKDVLLDFSFTNMAGVEDKPTAQMSKKDNNKTDYSREGTFCHWSNCLSYKGCTQDLCALSCHFNKLHLRILTTRDCSWLE